MSTLEMVLPGATRSLWAMGLVLVALLISAFLFGRCSAPTMEPVLAATQHVERAKVATAEASALRAERVNDSVAASRQLARAAAAEAKATRSREFAALHAAKVTVIDSTHVDVGDSVATVPTPVSVQLTLDQIAREDDRLALEAKSLAIDALTRENIALQLENVKLWTAVAEDSTAVVAFQHAHSPRCSMKCGVVIGAIVVAAIPAIPKAAAALLSLLTGGHRP